MSATAAGTRQQRVQSLSAIPLSDREAERLANVIQFWPDRLDHKNGTGRCYPYDEVRSHLRTTSRALDTGLLSATQWDHANHLQRSWTLTPAAAALGESLRSERRPSTQKPTTPAETPKATRGRPRTRAVNRFGKSGNRVDDVPGLSRSPSINLNSARDTLKAKRAELKTETDPAKIKRIKSTCNQLQHAIDGNIDVDYRATDTGRLQGQGRHIQNFTREARAALLPDCIGIDAESCHHRIIQQLARQHGIDDSPGLDDYIKNKRLWRESLSLSTGAPIKLVKQALISLAFCASISGRKGTAIADELGEYASSFITHQDVIDLHADLKFICDKVVKHARRNANRKGNIVNAVGTGIHKSAKPAQIMAHLCQGVEAMIMREVVRILDRPVELWMHDGLILREALTSSELNSISYQVEKRTGFAISLEQSPINPAWIQGKQEIESGLKAQRARAEGAPLTVHGSDKPLFLLTISADNYGFVQSENQAEKEHKTGNIFGSTSSALAGGGFDDSG